VNTDVSFSDAFGMLLANKYQAVSGATTIAPFKACRAIGPDSNLTLAAQALGADEYLEVSAVGLYVSRHEKKEIYRDSAGTSQRIIVDINQNNGNSEKSDQTLLDENKTIVTVSRLDRTGTKIHRVEMTLLTYGDIEESTERIALALFKKVSIESTQGLTNITRREGMGDNKLFAAPHKGVKMSMFYPVESGVTYSGIINLAFNYKADAKKYFLEFGIGGKLPTDLGKDGKRMYGGVELEAGASYFLYNDVVGIFAGGGISPFFNISTNMGIGITPYLQIGVLVPRNSKVCFYTDFRIGQNVMPIETTGENSSYNSISNISRHTGYPTEIGFEVGIGW
jgi:hypothetical protein